MKKSFLKSQRMQEQSSLLAVHILHIMTRFLIHLGTKSHHFLSLMGEVALKDTYLISLPLVGTLPQNGSLPLRQFPLSLDGPAYEWYDNLRPGSNIKLETDAKGLGKHSGQRIGLRKQIKLKCLPS